MKIVYLLILLVLVVASFTGFPQSKSQANSEDFILQSITNEPTNQSSNGESNSSVINQVGADNIGIINQFQQQYGIGNYAMIDQDGSYNEAIITQYGNDISTTIGQYGSNNYADIYLSGYDIDANILQNGDDNYIQQDISGNDINYSVIQNGNSNQYYQQQNNLYAKDFQVTQNGNGITTVIIDGPGGIIK